MLNTIIQCIHELTRIHNKILIPDDCIVLHSKYLNGVYLEYTKNQIYLHSDSIGRLIVLSTVLLPKDIHYSLFENPGPLVSAKFKVIENVFRLSEHKLNYEKISYHDSRVPTYTNNQMRNLEINVQSDFFDSDNSDQLQFLYNNDQMRAVNKYDEIKDIKTILEKSNYVEFVVCTYTDNLTLNFNSVLETDYKNILTQLKNIK